MGGKRSKKKKTKTAAQKAATARHAKFKQTRVQTFGGKRTSFSNAEKKRIKDAGYSVSGYSKAAPNKASGYSGTTGVSIGSKIKNPNPKTTGVGPVASGSEYANMLKANPPRFNEAGRNEVNQNIATNYNDLGSGLQNILQNQYRSFEKQGLGEKELQRLQKMYPGFTPRASINDGSMLASEKRIINPYNIFQTREALNEADAAREGKRDTIENPGFFDRILNRNSETQKAIDQASLTTPTFGLTASTSPMAIRTYGTGPLSGITEDASSASGLSRDGKPLTKTEAMSTFGIGGLNLNNIGGTDRAVTSETSEQRADRYKSTLNPDSFKGLSDGETFGSGPVASGEDYARGLNVSPYGSVENTMRSVVGKIPFVNRIPGVNTRLLTDKEIADKRVSAQNQLAYRNEMAKFRGGASGGNRLPVTPTVIEEILPEALPVPSPSTTPTTQTGVDPNRLLQIQQQAYAQAYNPMLIGGFNPQFRFGATTPTIDYSTYFNY